MADICNKKFVWLNSTRIVCVDALLIIACDVGRDCGWGEGQQLDQPSVDAFCISSLLSAEVVVRSNSSRRVLSLNCGCGSISREWRIYKVSNDTLFDPRAMKRGQQQPIYTPSLGRRPLFTPHRFKGLLLCSALLCFHSHPSLCVCAKACYYYYVCWVMANKPWILLFLPFGLSTCVVDALHAAETTHLPPHLSQWHKPRQLLLDASRRAHWLKFNCTIACLYTTHPPSHTHFSIKTLTLAFVFVRNKCRSDKPAPVFNAPFFLIISDR